MTEAAIRITKHSLLSRQSVKDAEIEASWREASDDLDKLARLWNVHGPQLLKGASRIANPEEIEHTLALAKQHDPPADQTVLKSSAAAANAPLFQYTLESMPDPR